MKIITLLKKSFILLIIFSGCSFKPEPALKQQIENYQSSKQYEQAVAAYWQHIETRLAQKNRPDWENPYIYLLDIGDIYLEQEQIKKAVDNYLLAEKHQVKPEYINDRMRFVASWYEKKGLLREAIEHLKKNRERDELLFDLMLNRLARQLVESEDMVAEKSNTE